MPLVYSTPVLLRKNEIDLSSNVFVIDAVVESDGHTNSNDDQSPNPSGNKCEVSWFNISNNMTYLLSPNRNITTVKDEPGC